MTQSKINIADICSSLESKQLRGAPSDPWFESHSLRHIRILCLSRGAYIESAREIGEIAGNNWPTLMVTDPQISTYVCPQHDSLVSDGLALLIETTHRALFGKPITRRNVTGQYYWRG